MKKSFVNCEIRVNNFFDKKILEKNLSSLSKKEKCHFVCKELLGVIQQSKEDFLLGVALSFIDYIRSAGIIQDFSFGDFEFWLNNHSELDVKENYYIRGKLAGRYVPREEYQQFFPIGGGVVFPGNHFVFAHASPDLDTTVASFWGWVDSFAAKVSKGVHYWIVPGGALPPQPEIEMVFFQPFGQKILSFLGGGEADPFVTPDGKDTATLRDFSNRQEGKIPSCIDIISVVDHHKSSFASSIPTVVTIADVQSSNTLMAEQSFYIHDRYGTSGMSLDEINMQINYSSFTPSSIRILQRLLQKLGNCKREDNFFISPRREFLEYLQYLYAIVDDTDFFAKVTLRDLECVKSLLNRLESLAMRQEVEIIHFDDIVADEKFVQNGVEKILRTPQMKFFCDKIYLSREKKEEENLYSMDIFSDTKEQNGCCFVGQTKIFVKNFPIFIQQAKNLRKKWLLQAKTLFGLKKEICFHLHMISTLFRAEDNKDHQDEMWIWTPLQDHSLEHLRCFLKSFSSKISVPIQVNLIEDSNHQLEKIFLENTNFTVKTTTGNDFFGEAFAVLQFKAGAINSRKAQITPHLPTIKTNI